MTTRSPSTPEDWLVGLHHPIRTPTVRMSEASSLFISLRTVGELPPSDFRYNSTLLPRSVSRSPAAALTERRQNKADSRAYMAQAYGYYTLRGCRAAGAAAGRGLPGPEALGMEQSCSN